jgi:hypothetical protein
MAEIKHGTVAVTVDDTLSLPEKAGNMTPEEVRRVPKARRGIGLVGEHTADALTKAGAKFIPPPGVTVESLLAACRRAESIDQVITDLDVIVNRLKQANLIFDAEAWAMLLKINDQVKVQAKHEPELEAAFSFLRDFMKHGPRAKTEE